MIVRALFGLLFALELYGNYYYSQKVNFKIGVVIQPPPIVFSIWSVIYMYQFYFVLISKGFKTMSIRNYCAYGLTFLFNVGWLATFEMQNKYIQLLSMIGLIISLLLSVPDHTLLSSVEKQFFGIYTGWIFQALQLAVFITFQQYAAFKKNEQIIAVSTQMIAFLAQQYYSAKFQIKQNIIVNTIANFSMLKLNLQPFLKVEAVILGTLDVIIFIRKMMQRKAKKTIREI